MRIVFWLLLIGTGLSFFGCSEPISEVKDSIHSAQDNSLAETHYFATYDVVYDVISTNGKMLKAEATILPSGAIVTIMDSVFTDGDGLEFVLDFGPLNIKEPKGLLCQDGRYRAGKIHITANSKFLSPELKVVATIAKDDLYYSGNGSEMVQLTGMTTLAKLTQNSIRIDVTDAVMYVDTFELSWNSSRVIELIDDKGPGIWGDVYKVTGSATGVNRFGEHYMVNIDEALIKKMEAGCARTFVQGILTVTATNSNKVIAIDYDPYKDQACDLFAEADIQGRKTIFRVR